MSFEKNITHAPNIVCSYAQKLWFHPIFSRTAEKETVQSAPARFELAISCLLDRHFNQLSHGVCLLAAIKNEK